MTPPTIKSVRSTADRLVFNLDNDHEVSLPLATSQRLADASPAQRAHWTLGVGGLSVHWPDVDEDIAVWEVLGIPEDVYLRSMHKAPVG
jgi:hypothetical protein